MKLRARGERLVIDDTPRGAWTIGLLCAMSGAMVMLVPLLGHDAAAWRPRDRAIITLLIGLPFLAAGLLLPAPVRGLDFVRSRDEDGDATFRLRLRLGDSRRLLLQGRAAHGEEHHAQHTRTIRDFLALPAAD